MQPGRPLHPRFAQSTGKTAGTFTELRVSETTVSTNHGGLAGELLFGMTQESYGGKGEYSWPYLAAYQAD